MSPSRCTQNATFGDEWRRGWHPETFAKRQTSARLLVVGAGPAGLEAARVAGMRGYDVALAEGDNELGGRVSKERKLPGLSPWGRVADYRAYQLSQLANVGTISQQRAFGRRHIELRLRACRDRRRGAAGGATALRRFTLRPIEIAETHQSLLADDLMDGKVPRGRIIDL